MYDKAIVDKTKDSLIKDRISAILRKKNLYTIVCAQTNVPWDCVACIHSLETDLSLEKHLHNGDPLERRTVNIPKGRPINGKPPFTWVESACDAIGYFPKTVPWDMPTKLYFLESYNGLGYRKKKINSPYLWSMTDQYTKGKFIQDGNYDPEAISKQIGAVPLLKHLDQLTNK